MNSRKILKKRARENIHNHYFRNVILVFICSLMLTSGFSYSTCNILESRIGTNPSRSILYNNRKITNSDVINEIIKKIDFHPKDSKKIPHRYTRGVIAGLINQVTDGISILFNFLHAVNKYIFSRNFNVSFFIILSTIILFVFKTIFLNVLIIGKDRYFIEQRKYRDTKLEKLFFPYKMRKTLHLAYILFMKKIYQALWSLTIVGGFIKHYEYAMIPYILAENPNISKDEAFKLSRELVSGWKWWLFKLDLSMIGWSILSAITFRLSSIFYSDIYLESLYAEVYMNIRSVKRNNIEYGYLLNDSYLDTDEVEECYPEEKFTIAKDKTLNIFKLDYNRNYDFLTYILLFFTFSFIGFMWEVFLHLLNDGVFVNRGTMHGPWLPIYGTGGVLILFLLKRFRDNPLHLFIAAFILCGVIEYSTAWYLETFLHLSYWNYSGYFLNLDGRICLEGLLLFGLGGCGFTYILAPMLYNLYKNISHKLKVIICILLVFSFGCDFVYSSIHPNVGKGISRKYVIKK